MVSATVSTETKPSDARIIDDSAQAVAVIRLTHRNDIQRMRKLLVEYIGELEQADKEKMSLQTRVAISQKIAETHKTVVNMEREHFGITAAHGDEDNPALAPTEPVELARKIAFLFATAINKGA
jgi:hypothetical protein